MFDALSEKLAGICLLPALFTFAALGFTGCTRPNVEVQPDSPEAAAATELMLPKKIEIQRYWTQPVSLAGGTAADGLEVVLAAFDACGDNIKMVGTLHIELYTRRPASGDKFGKRIGFWPVELSSMEQATEHWDPLARFYRFPLKLAAALPPGRYILTTTLQPPCGDRLMDQYEFEHEPKAAEKSAQKAAAGKNKPGKKASPKKPAAGSP